jgi:hypothetical protein
MNILVNNRNRVNYLISTTDGIIGKRVNEKKRADQTKYDAYAEGIVPFNYIDENGVVKTSTTCAKGNFIINGKIIRIPNKVKWCANKVDVDGNMIEWGYCIENSFVIHSFEEALRKAVELLEAHKPNTYIIGYLKTYLIDDELRKRVINSEELKELLRNKEKLPDIKLHKLGDEVIVKGISYVLEDTIEAGISWIPKRGESLISKRLKEPIVSLPPQQVSLYGTNKDQSGQQIVHTYRGILNRDYNLAKRGKKRRVETTKPCIIPFDYLTNKGKRISSDECVAKGMTIEGDSIRYPGDPWCATEVDETGLMREWGYCTDKRVEGDVEEEKIWKDLCNALKNEQPTKVQKIVRELLLEGYTEKTIFNMLTQLCNRKLIAPNYSLFKQLVNIEFINLYPWVLVGSAKPNKDLLKPRDNLDQIIISKLKYLESVFYLDLTNGLILLDSKWLLYYYYLVERIIVSGIISKSKLGVINVSLIKRAKQIGDLKKLNNALLNLEKKIKTELKEHIQTIDKTGVYLDFNNRPSELNSEVNINLIIVNNSPFFGHVEQEQRKIYYDILDVFEENIPEQLMYYNTSFVEPKELVEQGLAEAAVVQAEAAQAAQAVEAVEALEEATKRETIWSNSNIEFYSNYPEVNDPQFFVKIQQKQEFRINKMESWANKRIEDLCRQDIFELSPQQQWIANFFNVETPYRGLLLWWGTGVGKTCASISIAEKHLDYYKKYNKKILVILGTSTLENYKKELYNFKKERIEIAQGLIPGTLQCTKDRYYIPIDSNNPAMLKKREQKILKRIEQDYEFITYGSLKGLLGKLLQRRGVKLDYDGDKLAMPKIKPTEEGQEVKIGEKIFRAVKTRVKPGLVWKRLVVVDEIKEQRTRLAISEYFSNRLIIVDEIQNIRTTGEGGDQIAPQMLEKIIHYSEDIKLVMMSATPMFNNATEIIYILNLLLENDGREKVKANDLFNSRGELINPDLLEEVSRGYISYVRGANPISFPLKKLPNQSDNLYIRENNIVYLPRPNTKMNGEQLDDDEYIRYNSLVKCDMSRYQEEIFKRVILGEEDAEGNLGDATDETFDIKGKVICNIVYPSKDLKNLDNLHGETGFKHCFTEDSNTYEYTDSSLVDGVPFLDRDLIGKYSTKFSKILNNILSTNKGIIFVYSEYKKGGSIPLTLMLEQNGFEQLVIEGKYGEPIVKNKLSSPLKKREIPLKIDGSSPKWRYVLLDGDLDPKKRAQIIEKCNSEENKEGNLIKVIIGTRVAGEGVDFTRIRQVHILNPWDNLSRIDQIIGRGIRNCSHKDLPPEDRNVTIFLYSAHIRNNSIETTDEKIHRRAEKKDIQMKEVEIIMRNNSIDCMSNYLANRYTIEEFGNEIGDKDGTRECAYRNCEEAFICKDKNKILTTKKVDLDTYMIENHASREIQRYKLLIKKLFEITVIFDLEQIRNYVKSKLIFDNDIFLVALDNLIRTKEKLNDKYRRVGHLVFKNGFYLFQPDDLSKTENLPVYYRETPLKIKPIRTKLSISERKLKETRINKWVMKVKEFILDIDDNIELAYNLDRVKDIVMKQLILEWFNGNSDPSVIEDQEIHNKLTDYLFDKDVVIWDDDRANVIAICWRRYLAYEYSPDTKELKEYTDGETYKHKTEILDFTNYPFETHCIGKLEKVSEGSDDSYEHEVAFKIIDFSFLQNRSKLRLDGKSCMSYNQSSIDQILANLDVDIEPDWKRSDKCQNIEIALRRYNAAHYEDKRWWLESHIPYVLQK